MLKKIIVTLIFSVSCALLLTACSKSDNTPTTTTSSPATTTTASSGDKIGVPECDDYMAKLEACLAKLPAAAKEQYEKTFEPTRKAWRDLAATPQGKASLAQACKKATLPSACE
jgi:uncharacterized lipoprotein YehR (DUF1307 family)